MKKWLIHELICPECLSQGSKKEVELTVHIQKEDHDDILEGHLVCPECGRNFTISDGIAVVVPRATMPVIESQTGYNSFSMLASYLWSHYSEFFNGPDATDAYKKWAACLTPQTGWALDIGSSVGRMTFEMTKNHDKAIGIDTSLSFIRAARIISAQKRLEFDMIIEGEITEHRSCELAGGFEFDNAEFIVADAMALPFRSQKFTTTSSINVLEKVPDPSGHLAEANRLTDAKKGQFLFSDPFSWDESVSPKTSWLGGLSEGAFKGFGMDNICRLFEDPDGIFSPGFSIREKGDILWKIRKTKNLWEHITSQFVMAQR